VAFYILNDVFGVPLMKMAAKTSNSPDAPPGPESSKT
jgi:hypothetical protein